MRNRRIVCSIILAFFFAFTLAWEKRLVFFAALLAIIIHEAGHIFALLALGFRIKGIKLELCGLRIDYGGGFFPVKETIVALSGPAAGIICFFLFNSGSNELLSSCSQLGLLYSLFNLLPVLPLDGGRVLLCLAQLMFGDDAVKFVSVLSQIMSAGFCIFGLLCMLKGEGNAMFSAALWLLLLQS